MSGMMSGILGGLFGGGAGSGAMAGAGNLLAHVVNAAGGPAGIAQKFEQAGLGDKVQSWIGNGHNLPISAEQVERVFPPAQLDAWAQQHGLPSGMASQILAQFLPHAVDATTPGGSVPTGTAAGAGTAAPAASGSAFTSMIGRLTGAT